MYQPEACNIIAKYAKEKGLDIWVYTGFTWEQLQKMSEKKKIYKEFLENTDVLVDGKFVQSKKDLNLLFRGSSNQRLIDVQKTLKNKEIVLINESDYLEEKSFQREQLYI